MSHKFATIVSVLLFTEGELQHQDKEVIGGTEEGVDDDGDMDDVSGGDVAEVQEEFVPLYVGDESLVEPRFADKYKKIAI